MNVERETSYIVKVSLIPDEGMEGEWVLPVEAFASGKHPIPVAGPVSLHGRLYRIDTTAHMSGEISAVLDLVCSRCLKSFESAVKSEVTAVFMPRAGEAGGEREVELTGEEMDVQFYEGDQISLFEPVRDVIALAVPISPLCREDCKGLCPMCGADLNETTCRCEPPVGDPRFAALKNLKFK